MDSTPLADHARIPVLVAVEAVEDPDVVACRREVIDVLASLSAGKGWSEAIERAAPRDMGDPAAYVRAFADALVVHRKALLDNAPELHQALAFLALVLDRPAVAEQPASNFAAVAVA